MKAALLITISMIAFVMSVIIAPYHINGDQIHYANTYQAMDGLGLLDAFEVYRTLIFSYEPIHFFVTWCFANLGFNKNIAMAVLNSLTAFLFAKFLINRTKSYVLVLFLVFSNQYLYSFFFTLEKLKISIIFLLLFLNYRVRLFGFLAALAHFQVALLFGIYFTATMLSRVKWAEFSKFIEFRNFLKILVFALFGITGWALFNDYVVQKLFFYNEREEVGGLISLVPVSVVFLLTYLASSQDAKIVVWYFAILSLLIFMLGGDRMNMFAFFGFLYFANYSNINSSKGIISLIFLLFSILYLGYKSLSYLNMIIIDGG